MPMRRKDVTAKCYGGDISRKRKLLDKQKVEYKASPPLSCVRQAGRSLLAKKLPMLMIS